jgi:hypothetical protein
MMYILQFLGQFYNKMVGSKHTDILFKDFHYKYHKRNSYFAYIFVFILVENLQKLAVFMGT